MITRSKAIELAILLAMALLGAFSWMQRVREEPIPASVARLEKATLAGGCYWCMEPAFDQLEGVVHVRAGHAGDGTRRREAVEILFDPRAISYAEILDVFWMNVDPLDGEGQFCDRGSDYRSGIFVHDDSQRAGAETSRASVETARASVETARGFEVVTEILDAGSFLPAGEYDQNYYRKHPVRYAFYRMNCGRDARLHEVWSK